MPQPFPACVILIGVAATACGGGDAKSSAAKAPTVACAATTNDAVAAATTDYIKQAKPKPERFLIASGTDSALGDPGLVALQNKGPTYMFPGDPALQQQMRALLHEKGDYTTLLVVRTAATREKKKATVTLNGHYIGGESEGMTPGPRSYALGCDSTSWKVLASRAGA